MDNLDSILGIGNTSNIPNLDWLDLDVGDIKNMPSTFPVRILPQLEEAWSHEPKEIFHRIPTMEQTVSLDKVKEASDTQEGIVDAAKREIMGGHTGDALIERLTNVFPKEMLAGAKEPLRKVASEQGLLGNVYLDLTAFDSCKEAASVLNANKIRTAKYIVGSPKRHVCSSHGTGYCSALNKRVVSEVIYSEDLLKHYSDHLKLAGRMGANEIISSKEDLRAKFLGMYASDAYANEHHPEVEGSTEITKDMEASFEASLKNDVEKIKEAHSVDRFASVRPVLAFIQNEMLKGHIGTSLKEAISKKFSSDQIAMYENEIRKIASLQGILGNVYVDVSYYKTPEEAVSAIKTASTSPQYLVQTRKAHSLDDTLEQVAHKTGCAMLPKDGKIDKRIASSYIDDLYFNNRISSNMHVAFKKEIEEEKNTLGVIRYAFVASNSYKPSKREGGVQGYYAQGERKKANDRGVIKLAVSKAFESGISINKIEEKVASYLPTTEAIGMIYDVLSSTKEVDANSLDNCTKQKYNFASGAQIKKADKCAHCILKANATCTVQGARFAGEEVIDKAFLVLDPNTAKVMYKENPDVVRDDMEKMVTEVPDNFGSGMEIALNKMFEREGMDISLDTQDKNIGLI